MIQVIQLILIALVTILFTSCACKPEVVTKTEYVYEKPYEFETVSMEGVYIELPSKELQRLCTPSLLELDTVHKGIREYYEWQIGRYMEDHNDTRREK